MGTDRHAAVTVHARPDIPVLTSLRFFAAFVVLISHMPGALPLPGGLTAAIFQGGAGTAFFFVLSGFVLTYNYYDRFAQGLAGAGSYLRARFARIYPMQVVALLATTALVVASPARYTLMAMPPLDVLGSWASNLFILHAYFPSDGMHFWNGPSWSISAEMFFYLCLPPFVYLVLRRIEGRAILSLAALFFVIEAGLFFAVAAWVAGRNLGKPDDWVLHLIDLASVFPPMRVWEFLIGALLAKAFLLARSGNAPPLFGWLDRRRVRDVLAICAAPLIFLIPLIVYLSGGPAPGLSVPRLAIVYLIFVPVSAVLIVAVAWGPTWLGGLLERPWLHRLGEASYSLYILQMVPIMCARLVFHGEPPGWAQALVVVAAVALSLVSYRFIENPARKWLAPKRAPAKA